jgi:hypothetical protein
LYFADDYHYFFFIDATLPLPRHYRQMLIAEYAIFALLRFQPDISRQIATLSHFSLLIIFSALEMTGFH